MLPCRARSCHRDSSLLSHRAERRLATREQRKQSRALQRTAAIVGRLVSSAADVAALQASAADFGPLRCRLRPPSLQTSALAADFGPLRCRLRPSLQTSAQYVYMTKHALAPPVGHQRRSPRCFHKGCAGFSKKEACTGAKRWRAGTIVEPHSLVPRRPSRASASSKRVESARSVRLVVPLPIAKAPAPHQACYGTPRGAAYTSHSQCSCTCRLVHPPTEPHSCTICTVASERIKCVESA
jgi:hypothetical protein